jgi:hypothetical protein
MIMMHSPNRLTVAWTHPAIVKVAQIITIILFKRQNRQEVFMNNLKFERTGHNYDFIAIVTYDGTEPVLLITTCLECGEIISSYTSGGPHALWQGKTFGILADPEGWGLLEAFEAGSYLFEVEANMTPDEYLEATCAFICSCNNIEE